MFKRLSSLLPGRLLKDRKCPHQRSSSRQRSDRLSDSDRHPSGPRMRVTVSGVAEAQATEFATPTPAHGRTTITFSS